MATTLREAGLAPRGTLLVLAEHSRGLVRRAGEEEDDSEIGQQMLLLQQLLAEMPVGAPPPGDAGSYEEMLEYAERVGQVSTGLSVAQVARLPTRTVEDEPPEPDAPDAPRCCICCYGHAKGDVILALPCGHDYHLECIAPWLRAKRICPLCKTPAVPPPPSG